MRFSSPVWQKLCFWLTNNLSNAAYTTYTISQEDFCNL